MKIESDRQAKLYVNAIYISGCDGYHLKLFVFDLLSPIIILLLIFKVLSFAKRPSSGGIVPTRLESESEIEVTSPGYGQKFGDRKSEEKSSIMRNRKKT